MLLLDEFIERRLLLRLLRITIIRDEYQPLRRNDECRIVSAKATEIEKVDFLRHDNGIEPPLSEQGAECLYTLLDHASASPFSSFAASLRITASSAAI